MLFINQFLSAAGLTEDKLTNPSIACISTTRPIYMVFGDESDHPAYVIRKLNDDHDVHSQQVHNRLYQLAGNQVPEPVGVYEYAGAKYDVQRGVSGAPWFQIKSKVRTAKARTHLEKNLWNSLTDFHSAIGTDAAHKSNNLQPHDELLQAYALYLDTEHTVDDKLGKLVGLAVSELSEIPSCPSIPQHGDFCLNNLIIDTSHITVIDFEDFEITAMPLYDYFTLALSLPSCSEDPSQAIHVLNEPQIVTTAQSLGIASNTIRWHFLHHILLRLGPWSTGEKRAGYREWLKKILESFIKLQLKM
ncbi:phosphotransferase [Marinobacter salexigens]|uniref:phosphotransferase n=1 Tax=Marinobacter salexigens TaxID=1925763 RepID=UPI000C2929C7|nr:phosphotransferase [Marinobacter salexigens]